MNNIEVFNKADEKIMNIEVLHYRGENYIPTSELEKLMNAVEKEREK